MKSLILASMAVHTVCKLCDSKGTLEDAREAQAVPCNVRRFQDRLFTMWRCNGCNSLHCAEDADLVEFYRNYPLEKQKMDFHLRVGFKNRLKLLRRQGFGDTGRLLDYGCGSGLFIDYLRAQNIRHVSGYDAFAEAFADKSALDETYDAVVSYDVIEHAEDPRDFMRTIAALVRPGGLAVVGTPNADRVALERKTDLNLHVPYHRHILSERALLLLAREQGLVPKHVYHRSYFDSLIPTVNWRFISAYNEAAGGLLDLAVEPPQPELVTRSPGLLFLAFFGYFLPSQDSLIVTFQKPQD